MLCTLLGWTADKSEKLDFNQAMALALKRNHQIEIARNNATIARNNVHIGNAGLLPTIGISSSANYQESPGGMSADPASTTTSAQLQGSYTLFDGLGNIYRFKRLQSGSRLGELQARGLIEATLLQVSGAYYNAASAFENLQIARELVEVSRQRLQRARTRSMYGQARSIDVLSAQVDYIADQVTVTQATFQWDEARRSLNVLLNRPVSREYEVDTTVTFSKTYNLKNLHSQALAMNAEFLTYGEQANVSRFDLKLAAANFLPRLDLSASYGFNHTLSGFNVDWGGMEKNFRLGATLSLNLFNGFQNTIQRQNAKITLRNKELAREQAKLELEKEVTSAYEAYLNSLQVLELEKQYVQAAELNFKRTRELFNLGQLTTTQFREAQLNLVRARSNLSAAKYGAKIKEIELLRLTGQLLK
jgi:outer membrane protein